MGPGPFAEALAGAASDSGQDRDGVAVSHRGLQPAEAANVLVVQVDVDEAAQLLAVEQPVTDADVVGVQVLDQLVEGGTGPLDHLRAAGVGAQNGRDANLNGHEKVLLSYLPGADPRTPQGFPSAVLSNPERPRIIPQW